MKNRSSRLDLLQVEPNELIEALNDPAKAEALMKAKGMTREDLLKNADLLSKELSAAMAAVLVV